jgi:hypothetical protein
MLMESEVVRKGSFNFDEDIVLQSECIIYAAGRTIHAIEIRQPSFVHQQICFNLEGEEGYIVCLNGFALPPHYQNLQSSLSVTTALLFVLQQNGTQTLKLYDDRGKDLNCDMEVSHVLWVTSQATS